MSTGRGHQSIYFKDPEVLENLEKLSEKTGASVSTIVNEVMGKALPDLTKSVNKGKKQTISVSFTVDL